MGRPRASRAPLAAVPLVRTISSDRSGADSGGGVAFSCPWDDDAVPFGARHPIAPSISNGKNATSSTLYHAESELMF